MVDGASGESLSISDGHFDESGMRCLGGNAAGDAPIRVRQAPQVAIKLEACHNGEVNHVHFWNFRVAGVKLDSQSQHNRVSNIRDSGQLAASYTDDTYLGADHPANSNVQNLGVHNQVICTRPRDFSALRDDLYLGRRNLDGYQVSIASRAIDVGPMADGGKVYITGDDSTATIGMINGGYLGQEILLVTYYSSTVTLTDGPSLDLGAGNYSLTQGKGIRLICNAAAGNSWIKVNF